MSECPKVGQSSAGAPAVHLGTLLPSGTQLLGVLMVGYVDITSDVWIKVINQSDNSCKQAGNIFQIDHCESWDPSLTATKWNTNIEEKYGC